MSTFTSSIAVTDREAIAIPDGPSISYRHLSSITGHLQQMFTNSASPLSPLRLSPPSPLSPPLSPPLSQTKAKNKIQTSIAISLKNNLELVASFLAITNSSRIAAPLNPNYTKTEFDFYFEDLKASAVIINKNEHLNPDLAVVQSARQFQVLMVEVFWDNATKRVEFEIFDHVSPKPLFQSLHHPIFINNTNSFPGGPQPDEVALILHTSGTTGRPKTVPLTHGNISRSMENISNTYKLTPSDRSYIVMPLFHVHGLIGALLSTLHSQGTAIIPIQFSARKFWNDFIKHRANWYSAVPTIHLILLNTSIPSTLPKIRFIRSCSAALAPDTFRKLEETFNAPVLEAYAMTEAAHQMCSNNLPPGLRKPGTVGQGQGVDVVVLNDDGKVLPKGEIGEVSIKGSNVTSGYLNNDKANAESYTNGYFRTGDQGFFDEDGFLNLTGRLKELINRGGEKISPIELDGVLLSHPLVSEAVAFGASDAKYGQVVHAAIVLKKGDANGKDNSVNDEELKRFCAVKLAKFKVPEKFYYLEKLPKTATGKIQRRNIAKTLGAQSKL